MTKILESGGGNDVITFLRALYPVAAILWESWGPDPLTFWHWGSNVHGTPTFYCGAAIHEL